MRNNILVSQIQKMPKEDISKFNVEQFAGLILKIYKNEKNDSQSQYNRLGYESALLLFEQYGINDKFNYTQMPCGGIIEHMGMPAAIEEKFYEALSFLKDHKFLKTSSGQNPNSDWNRLTEEGEKVKINEDNTILIKRFSEELVEMFEQSVFLMAGKNENGDFDNGTCFLFDKNDDSLILLTAKHVVEGITSEQKIYLSKDKSISVNLDNVKIRKSPDSDVAVLLLSKSHAVDTIKCHRTFKNVSNTYKQGEDVVSLGYPHLARLKEISLNSSKNNISLPHAEEFYGERSILLDRFLSPGYSGGPLINMKGELLGIISKNLINTKDSSKTDGDKFASIVPFVEVENILKN